MIELFVERKSIKISGNMCLCQISF